MAESDDMPSQADLMWPVLRALERLGGSASIRELDDRVATDMGLGEAVLNAVHADGPQSEFAYRCGWARTRLRRIGAVDNSARGVWAITEAGRKIRSADETTKMARRQQHEYHSGGLRGAEGQADGAGHHHAGAPGIGDSWQADLLEMLRSIDPSAFERLCQRLASGARLHAGRGDRAARAMAGSTGRGYSG